jgi:1-phosphatidylinositol-4-phosphate 5-kinase
LGPENFLGNLILTKNRSLREMTSAGKSGSLFYFSYDNKFVLKTISTNEFEFFKSIIEKYYFHIEENKNTLIQRFFGLHTLIFNNMKMHFVIMNNVLNTKLKINYKYDLKGSSYSRLSRNIEDLNYEKFDFNIPMKDNDLSDRKESFFLNKEKSEMLSVQIKKDTEFLAANNINDYSLLIGVHNLGIILKFILFNYVNCLILYLIEINKNIYDNKIENIDLNVNNSLNSNSKNLKEKRIPFYEKDFGGLFTYDQKKIIFIAIIDIFTEYG